MRTAWNKTYPWDEWLDLEGRERKTLRIFQGIAYTCSHAAMAQQIRNVAINSGMRVIIEEITTKVAKETITGLKVTFEIKKAKETNAAAS